MKAMKYVFGLFLCIGIGLILTSCTNDEDENRAKLVGTWTETNNLYSVTLTLTDDGNFDFNTGKYAPDLNGSGTYKYSQDKRSYNGLGDEEKTNKHLTLTYTSKSKDITFEVMDLTSSRLSIQSSTRYKFQLTK